jgi:predicted RNA-binding Zn-ribbon protein involved in translation (DUF1610 family)
MHTSSQPTIQTKYAVYQCPCPQCHGGTLMISRIEPHGPGYELRTFECAKCGREKVLRSTL